MSIEELTDFLQLKIERAAEKREEALKKAKKDMEETVTAAASAKMRYEELMSSAQEPVLAHVPALARTP
eukprot:2076840-Pyramimonas_sp.AAC.1